MKKKLPGILLVICMLVVVFIAVGCNEEIVTSSIAVVGESNVCVNDFKIENYKLAVTKSDGSTEEIPLLSEFISAEDLAKLQSNGSHTVTVNYDGVSVQHTFNLSADTFEGITFADKTVVYNGEPQSLEIVGVPSFASIAYDKDITYVNAGAYTVQATVTAPNYNALTLSATLTIQKATVSGISFAGAEFTYDATPKSLGINGTLPEGVSVRYEGNDQINVGTYTVTAIFTVNGNYNAIENKTATLRINAQAISGVTFANKTVVYNGQMQSLEISGVPSYASVSYDNELSYKNVGQYTVTATVSAQNYTPQVITATLTIEKRELNVVFSGERDLTYNKKVQKTISVTASNFVAGEEAVITLTYSGGMVEAGVYTVTASINHPSYKITAHNTTTITISRAVHTVTLRQNGFPDKQFSVLDLENANALLVNNIPEEEPGYTVTWKEVDLTSVTESIVVGVDKSLIEYQIRYELNGGVNNEENPSKYTFESDSIIFKNPISQQGKTFAGWYTSATCPDEDRITDIKTGTQVGDVTLYAKWYSYRIESAPGFEIDYTGSMPRLNLTVRNDTVNIDLFDRFVISEGCTWSLYSDFMGANKYPLKAMTLVEGNNQAYVIVFYPGRDDMFSRYELNIYRLGLKEYVFLNEGATYSSGMLEETTALLAPETSPEKTAYSFSGWTVEGEVVTFPYQVNEDVIFIAKYTPNNYVITLNLRGGALEDNTIDYTVETGVSQLPTPTRDYYTFEGWFLTEECNEFEQLTFIPVGIHGDSNLYAKWEAIPYDVTYYFNGGVDNGLNPYTYNVETPTFELQATTRAGYTFDGWFSDSLLTESVNAIILGSNGDIELYAKWNANENTLNFVGNGNTSGEMASIKMFTDVTEELPHNAFERAGYTFVGWALSEDGEAVYLDGEEYTMGVLAEYTLYAIWQANENTLVFNGNGNTSGSMLNMKIHTDETKTLSANAFAKDYYHFVGWATEPNGAVVYANKASYTMGTLSEYTLYAVWEPDVYTIQYDLNDGVNNAGNTTATYTVESNDVVLLAPSRDYYNFVNWTLNGTPVAKIATGSHGDVILVANWTPIEYQITYELNDGTNNALNPSEYNVEESVTFSAPTKAGYTFLGWFSDELFETQVTKIKVGSHGAVKLYANWTYYTVTTSTNEAGGGTYTTYNAAKVTVGEEVTLTANTNPGYKWLGWYDGDTKVSEGDSLTYTFTMTATNKTYVAKWEVITYSITYHLDEGTNAESNPETFTVKNLPLTLGAPTKTDFHFAGWYTDASLNTKCPKLTTVGDVHLYAKFIEGTEGIVYTLSNDGTYYTVTGYNGTDTEIYVAKKYSNKPVTAVSGTAFQGNTSITLVALPQGITSIGENAFYNCRSLTSVTIGNSVTSIGENAFYDCYKLVEVYNLSSLTITAGSSGNGYVGRYAKNVYTDTEGESKLTTKDGYIVYADSVNNEYYLMGYVGNETVLTLPSDITGNNYSIYKYAFYNNTNITSITIPARVTSIGSFAFEYCYKLVEVYNLSSLSSGNGYVGYYAKDIYTSLDSPSKLSTTEEGYIVYADSVNNEYSLIGYVGNKTELTLLNNINGNNYSIYKYAFYNNDNITSVTIPNSVTSIGDGAFTGCTSLKYNQYNNAYFLGNEDNPYLVLVNAKNTSITSCEIHEDTRIIYSSAFGKCRNLTKVNYLGTIDQWAMIEFGNAYANPLYYAKKLYIKDVEVTEVVLTTATKISAFAFYNCSSITSVTIPNSVTSIGSYAFSGCSSLTSVTIGESVTSIGENAFSYCSSLTSVTIPNSVTSIGENAFLYCSSLTSVTIPNSVTSIGSYAFEYCRSLTSVTIGESVTSIGENAFYNCRSLTSVTIGDSVTSIGYYAFYYCYKLVEVYNLSSLNITIGSYANGYVAYYAKNVYTDTEEESKLSTTEDGYIVYADDENSEYSLMGYTGTATELTLPSDINGNNYSIYQYAFYNNDNITSVTIPNSVTSIGNSSFRACSSLQYNQYDNGYYLGNEDNPYLVLVKAINTSITSCVIHEDTRFIHSEAFYNCSSITSITIPKNVTSIGYYAFYDCKALTEINFNATAMDDLSEYADVFSNGREAGSGIEVNIGANVTKIPAYLFYPYSISSYAPKITSVTIGDSVTSIGQYAFCGCSSLTKVNYLGTIDQWAMIEFGNAYANPLYYAKKLYIKDVEVTEVVLTTATKISAFAFYNCSSITSVTIPNSVTSIGKSAFCGCSSLTSVTIGESVTSIGDYAFYYCSSLTSITIPESVTSIGYYAFSGCSSLTSIVFEDTTTWYRTNDYTNWQNKTGGTSTSVTNSSTNAMYFKSTYASYYWYKR